MKTTLNQALEIAETGNWDKAWKVAQEDEGLNPTTTKAQWIAFAKNAIARREAEARLHRHNYL